jgi:hypothetical protein
VVATGGGRDPNREEAVTTMTACSMFTMLNNLDMSLFVDHVASACLCRPAYMFWSCSMSIVIEITTLAILEEVGQGVVVLLTSGMSQSLGWFSIVSYN